MTDKTKVLIVYFSMIILSVLIFSFEGITKIGQISVYCILLFWISTAIVEYFKKDPES